MLKRQDNHTDSDHTNISREWDMIESAFAIIALETLKHTLDKITCQSNS